MYNKYLEDSIIEKINPVLRIVMLLLVTGLILIINSWTDIGVIFGFVVILILLSRVNLSIYFRFLDRNREILVLLLIFGIVGGFYASIWFIRIVILYLYYVMFIVSISTNQLISGINYIVSNNKVSLKIALFMRFILVYDTEIERLDGISGGTRRIAFKNSLTMNKEIEKNMGVRLYNYYSDRSNYLFTKWKIFDTIMVIISLVLLGLVVVF